MIVLNENEWAQDMIAAKSLGSKPYETLCRVARYYIDTGYDKKDVRRILETFLAQCKNGVSTVLWMDTLDRAVAYAVKHPAVCIDSIVITKPEIERIRATNGIQVQRLAFTLLCLSKYCSVINPDTNGWVWIGDHDIMKMANINTSLKRQSAMYRQLRDDGMLQFRPIGGIDPRVVVSKRVQVGEDLLPGVIGAMADRVLVMRNGETVEYGDTEQVLNHPREAYTRTLMAAVPRLKR